MLTDLMTGLETFDPENAKTVLEPEQHAPGYWVGCPSVRYEPEHERFLMTYRQRRPRGHSAERGWRCAIAESTDGVRFTDIWAVEKDELGTSSMERFGLTFHDGRYLLYVSYVDPADSRWRVDVVAANRPDRFDIGDAAPVLTAASTGTEGVKDPHPVVAGPGILLFASYADPATLSTRDSERAHASADIYATGTTTFPTGLASSSDGLRFDWRPGVLPVGAGWDRYQARLGSIVRTPAGFAGLYDGSASVEENYEERIGLALSADLIHWTRLTPHAPFAVSQHGSGSVRYADVVEVNREWFVYFEYACPSGAHELRLARLPKPGSVQ